MLFINIFFFLVKFGIAFTAVHMNQSGALGKITRQIDRKESSR